MSEIQAVHKIPTGKWRENCYLFCGHSLPTGSRVVVIDPGGDESKILDYISEHALVPVAIVNTHAHFDHIGAVQALKDTFQIPFYLHAADRKLLQHANLYRKIFEAEQSIVIPEIDVIFNDETRLLKIDEFQIEVLSTPGHTPGSVCLKIGSDVFTGDTLLQGRIGRVDLPGGDRKRLFQSLKEIARLDATLLLHPGHGEPTRLHEELQHNSEFLEAIA